MYVDILFRFLFYVYKGDIKQAAFSVYGQPHNRFIWDDWVETVGSYDSPEPEYHAVLIGPEWIGKIDLDHL